MKDRNIEQNIVYAKYLNDGNNNNIFAGIMTYNDPVKFRFSL